MREKLSSILIQMFSFLYVAYSRFNTSYYVTTFASGIQDSQSTTPSAFDDHLKYKNISIHAKLIGLPKSSGLSVMISTLSSASSNNFSSENREELIQLSQFSNKWKGIFEEVYWNKKLASSDITRCSQIFEENINTYGSCGKYKTMYADVLDALIYRTFVQPIMIAVDQDSCSHRLASMLKNSTYVDTGNYQEPSFHFVNYTSNLLLDLSQMLYKATIQSATTIILLCPDSLINLIFRLARSSAISYSNVIWVGIEYSSNINNELAPPLLLSVSLELDTNVANALLTKSARKVLAAKAVASLGLREKVISKRDGIEMVKQSLKALSEDSCLNRAVNAPIALVSLRQSQYTWMPLYTVGGDNAITHLVEDKKVSWLSRLKNHKAKIIVTTIREPPFVAVVQQYYNAKTKECSQGIKCRVPNQSSNGAIWEASCCIGSIMDLLKKLQEDLWLAIDLHIAKDGFFGSIFNGTWNGMIGELATGKADIAFATLTSTTKRSRVVDFGESFLQVTMGILVASNYAAEMNFFNFNFVANVTGNLLFALLGVFICGLIVLYVTENFVSHQRCQKKKYPCREGFSYISGIMFQRDLGGKNPQQAATRIMFIVFAFGMVIVMTTYTATLTAVQVKQDNNVVLTGINDQKLINPSDSFKFATLKSSSTQDYFRFSDNPIYQRMSVFMEKYNVDTSKAGAQKVVRGELQAFIAEYSVLQYYVSQHKNCLLRAIKTTNGQSSWNVAFKKDSPWKNIVSRKILEYKEKGLFDSIMTKWIQTKCISESAVHLTSQKYTIAHFSGLIILLCCVSIFSIMVLLFECCISKRIKSSSGYSLKSR